MRYGKVTRYLVPNEFFEAGAEVHPCAVIDFNGVLDTFRGWTGKVQDYDPAEGALDFVKRLKEELGFKTVIVLTATMPIESVMRWIEHWGFAEHIDYVTNHKPPAQVYIDDRAVLHTGDFEQTLETIRYFTPHWENLRDSNDKEVRLYDPADFIIEKRRDRQPSWHNHRIVYRLKRWQDDVHLYSYEGEAFWLNNLYSKLRYEFGIEKPEDTVPVVDLTS